MSKYSLAHLSHAALLDGLKANLARERDALALVLAHIAEVEARKIFRDAGYPSMQAYCVHELRLSKDAANKRVHAARAARDFPPILDHVAEGAICLSTVNLLAPHLTAENAEELLAETVSRTRFEVEQVLAARNPRPAVSTTIEPIAQALTLCGESADGSTVEVAPGRLQEVAKPPSVEPIAPRLYELRLTMTGEMYDKLRRATDLLGHRKSVPDEADLLEMGLDLLVARLEKQKYGATDEPRAARRSRSARYISHDVMRRVWERDEGQCTFVGDTGKRCPEASRLEYDHKQPVAKGGDSSVENVRLRCRAHNQLEAERAFGKPFMEHKRAQAKAAAAKRKAEEEAKLAAEKAAQETRELVAWLQRFGYSTEEVQFAVTECAPKPAIFPETRRLMCLAVLRERERERQVLPPTGT